MLVCSNSFSQTVTPKKTQPLSTEGNKVVIDTNIARLIANDLVRGDVCKEEIKLVKSNLALTKKEVVEKDSIINTLKKQKEALNLIISKKDEMFVKQEDISNSFKKDLSKQNKKTFFYKTLSLLGLISTTLLIIKP